MQAPDVSHLAPFAPTALGLTEPDRVRDAMRAAGPLVRAETPAGGPAWIVTDPALARRVLTDARLVKDPAFAPPHWDPVTAGLEATAADQPYLTTLDGPDHAALRKAHAPLLSTGRIEAWSDRVHAIARRLLAELAAGEPVVDLMPDFTTRYPLTVLLELLGIPLELVDRAVDGCRRMFSPEPGGQEAAIGALAELAAAGLVGGADGFAAELRERVPEGTTPQQLRYHLFGLIFAGQLTTDASLGFHVARLLGGDGADTAEATLRDHPPAPYTLWRYTAADIEIAGVPIPARSPVLVDIQGVNAVPGSGPDLTFGAGPHFCVGARLAVLELNAVAAVLAAEYPNARLGVPFGELRVSGMGGIQGRRLDALPVRLRG
ncbi:MAG TPA: hypothetical protein VGF17_22920 [Phytomonospora sp.]